jgi:hypothetical protein
MEERVWYIIETSTRSQNYQIRLCSFRYSSRINRKGGTLLRPHYLQGKVRKPKNHAVLETFADLNRQDVKDILTTVTASTLEAGKKQAPVNENDQDQPDQGGDEDGDGSDGEGSEDEAMFLLFD